MDYLGLGLRLGLGLEGGREGEGAGGERGGSPYPEMQESCCRMTNRNFTLSQRAHIGNMLRPMMRMPTVEVGRKEEEGNKRR